MCGLFGYFGSKVSKSDLNYYFEKIRHRGPDSSIFKVIHDSVVLGFHRLAINGTSPESNQPMYKDGVYLIANAEIFNYKQLANKYNIQLVSGSDCEIILQLYFQLPINELVKELDGEFAFVIYDSVKDEVFSARDHLGIRGLYMGRYQGDIAFASEAKALTFCDQLSQFPPACYWHSKHKETYVNYYDHEYELHEEQDEAAHLENIHDILSESVRKRLMSERPVGCLLSGGLDSSLVAALACKFNESDERIKTFSIGMPGSPDLIAALEVSRHIHSDHHHVELSKEQFISALEDTIYTLGSYDVTTIRASVGHKLISDYVSQNTDVKVLFSGETADEFGSYLYFQNAPTSHDFQNEAIRLLSDIHFFDMKRGDRSISSAGLEARVPFADKAFVKYIMGIDANHRMFDHEKMEKYLIRKAFEKEELLPQSVLWRRKNGFSDSVSSKAESWSVTLQKHIDTLVTDQEYLAQREQFSNNPPQTKEAYYYRKIFTQNYGKHQNLTPYQWLPKWCGDVIDPSARALEIYQAD